MKSWRGRDVMCHEFSVRLSETAVGSSAFWKGISRKPMALARGDSPLGALFRPLCSRMDKPRANTAVAHKLACMVYFMLRRGEGSRVRRTPTLHGARRTLEDYVDRGREHHEEQQRQRTVAALKRRANTFGLELTPAPVSARVYVCGAICFSRGLVI